MNLLKFEKLALGTISCLLMCLGLAGCSISEDSQAKQSPASNSSLTTLGTTGHLISIRSDNVRAAGYDETTKVMTVQFDNESIYEYYDVPADLWIAFLAAQPHPWSEVGYPQLVKGKFRYQKIN